MNVYLNGQIVPSERAMVSVFDRGYLMGDGVYEGLRSFRGRTHSVGRHVERFRFGLGQAGIAWDPEQLEPLTDKLLAANNLADAFIYWQVTRGVPGPGQPLRTRVPAGPMTPTVFGFCAPQPVIETFETVPTCSAAVVEDCRWTRGRLKSTSLLGNILGAIEAAEAGAKEALMVRDGLVTEGSATNVILALPTPDGGTELVTPSLDSVPILAGVTRARVLELDPHIHERAVREEELQLASEVILVGTTALVTSVTQLDRRPVGSGKAGPQARRLLGLFVGMVREELGLDVFVKLGRGAAQAA
jgi:D-alanine transaminase